MLYKDVYFCKILAAPISAKKDQFVVAAARFAVQQSKVYLLCCLLISDVPQLVPLQRDRIQKAALSDQKLPAFLS
jgi:hypothetical protein